MLIIGLNSGTSCDAIDVVLCKFSENEIKPKVLYSLSYSFPESLERKIKSIRSSFDKFTLKDIALLQKELSYAFMHAIQALILDWHKINETTSKDLMSEQTKIEEGFSSATHTASTIDAIGIHGQTIWHEPECQLTWQLLDPEIIAKNLGIDVVYDFRKADVALGGQGAPLTAIQDIILYGSDKYLQCKEPMSPIAPKSLCSDSHCVIFSQNIGGISNMTAFSEQGGSILGCYDQGPGNALMDSLALMVYNQKLDIDGEIARRGQVNEKLLKQLYSMPYFKKAPPKTTGIELFGPSLVELYIKQCNEEHIPLDDLMRTFCELTARCITDSYLQTINTYFADSKSIKSARVICQGGGARNVFLMERIKELLQDANSQCQWVFEESEQVDFKEAVLFAILACLNKRQLAANVPEITGARKRCILGSVASGQ